MIDWIYNIDFKILDLIQQNFKCDFCDKLFPAITLFGEGGIFWITLALIFFFASKKTRKMSINILLSLLLGVIIVNLIVKNLVGRERPYTWSEYQYIKDTLLIAIPFDKSFPSCHALACFEAATSIFIYKKKLGIAAYVIAAAVAFSRLYIFVHFPSDVLAGMIFGILIAVGVHLLLNFLYKNYGLEEKLILPWEKDKNKSL